MKCPYCGEEMKQGVVEARHAGSLMDSLTTVAWVPEDERKKLIRKHAVSLRINGEGWYCETCMKAVAVFEER